MSTSGTSEMIINVNKSQVPQESQWWQVRCEHCDRNYGILTLAGDEWRPERCSYCGHRVVASDLAVA